MLISIIAAGAAAATTFNILDAIENKIAEKRAAKKAAAASAAATTPTPTPTPVPVQQAFVPTAPMAPPIVQEEDTPSEEEGEEETSQQQPVDIAGEIIKQVSDLQADVLAADQTEAQQAATPTPTPTEPAEREAPAVESAAGEEDVPVPNTITRAQLLKGSKVRVVENTDINGNRFNKDGVYTVVNIDGDVAQITRGKKKRLISVDMANLELV